MASCMADSSALTPLRADEALSTATRSLMDGSKQPRVKVYEGNNGP